MRLAASKLSQHLCNLGFERRLVLAIVGPLSQHEQLDHRPQRVWLQVVGRDSDGGGDLLTAALPFGSILSSCSSCMCENDTRWLLTVHFARRPGTPAFDSVPSRRVK